MVEVFDGGAQVLEVVDDPAHVVAERVVLAAGIWSTGIAVLARLSIPVTTMKGDLLVVEPGQRITRRKTMEIGYVPPPEDFERVVRKLGPETNG